MTQQRSELQNNVAAKIMGYIERNGLKQGAHLSELGLAEEFGVSRSPVRKALEILEGHGVVRRERNKGFFLRKVDSNLGKLTDALPKSNEDQIYREVAADRISGALPDRVTEAELLRRYPVSRAMLTRVLNRMVAHGLIERATGHGWDFLPALLSEDAHDESYRFRLVIEPAALSEPSFHMDRDQLDSVRARHEQLLTRSRPVPAATLFEVNAEFHEMIARFSGNRYILQAVQQQNRLRQILEVKGLTDIKRIRQSCTEHLEIMNAIEAGDLVFAKSLLSHHLTVASRLKLAFSRDPLR